MTTTAPIKAIVVDPDQRTIKEVMLATKSGSDFGAGTQVSLAEFRKHLKCKWVEATYLGKAASLMVNAKSPDEGVPIGFWQYGPGCQPIPGIGVISGHDIMKDHAFDSPISPTEAHEKIKFTKRIIRAHKITEGEGSIAIERIAPIVEERADER